MYTQTHMHTLLFYNGIVQKQPLQCKDLKLMFVMLTGQRTTLHTDKCTDRIIRLCTSVALDGLNSTEKLVVCIVSILKYSHFSTFHPLKHIYFLFIVTFFCFKQNMQVCLLKGSMCFRDSAGGSYVSNITSPLAQTSEWRVFRKRSKRFKRCFAHPDSSADVISQCHVHSTCVVKTVSQGSDVDVGKKNPQVLKDFKC